MKKDKARKDQPSSKAPELPGVTCPDQSQAGHSPPLAPGKLPLPFGLISFRTPGSVQVDSVGHEHRIPRKAQDTAALSSKPSFTWKAPARKSEGRPRGPGCVTSPGAQLWRAGCAGHPAGVVRETETWVTQIVAALLQDSRDQLVALRAHENPPIPAPESVNQATGFTCVANVHLVKT